MKYVLAILALCVVLAAARPLAEDEYEALFTAFTKEHGKEYQSAEEFFTRYNIFKTNLDYIIAHQSKEGREFELKMNKFGDLTNDEFRDQYLSLSLTNRPRNYVSLPTEGLPSSVDWPKKGVVTPVKNQGQCGSCWAFSTTGSIEAAHAIKTGELISLSEQELVDCSGSAGNQGCNGGQMDAAFGWVEENGLCKESAYPYKAVDGSCNMNNCQAAVKITGYQDVSANDLDALKAAVAQQPVSVAVDAGGMDWQFYSGGILSDACGTQLDHGVLAAGYGSDGGKDFWLVKNSWGASWGESGYIRLKRSSGTGSGECGIAMDASYPQA